MFFHDVIVLASRCWQFFLCFPVVNRWAVCLSRLRRYLSCIWINHLTFFFYLHAGTFKYPVVFRYAFSCHSFLNIKMQTGFLVFSFGWQSVSRLRIETSEVFELYFNQSPCFYFVSWNRKFQNICGLQVCCFMMYFLWHQEADGVLCSLVVDSRKNNGLVMSIGTITIWEIWLWLYHVLKYICLSALLIGTGRFCLCAVN